MKTDILKKVVLSLHDLGAVKFGSFTLKSKIVAPIYIDLRMIISSPQLLKDIGDLLWEKVKHLTFDQLVGVPYTALPLASYLSLKHTIPMLMKRKEAKDYGTKRLIEGVYRCGERCLIIEDLVTSGASLIETVEPLEAEGLVVTGMVAFLDREQGGKERLEKKGYQMHFVTSLSEVLTLLYEAGRLSEAKKEEVVDFIRSHQVVS
jgi:uridine monophosphate synthetase